MLGLISTILKTNYLTIYDGKFTIRTNDTDPEAIARVNKNGVTVYEKYFPAFAGQLIQIKTRDGQYGKQWEFIFDAGGEKYTLALPYSGSYSNHFLKMLPNVDVTKPITLFPVSKLTPEGKKNNSLIIQQDGQYIKHAYTRENPNGLPPLELKTVRGQQVYDDTLQLEFLHKMVLDTVVPKLPNDYVDVVDSQDQTETQTQNDTPSGPMQGLGNAAALGLDDDEQPAF